MNKHANKHNYILFEYQIKILEYIMVFDATARMATPKGQSIMISSFKSSY